MPLQAMDNSSVGNNNCNPQFTHFGYYKTLSGYLPMCDQLAAAVAREFERRGFSVVRLSVVHNAPTLHVVQGDFELVIIINEHGKLSTERQREWADEQSAPVVWCSGKDHARSIAKAIRVPE